MIYNNFRKTICCKNIYNNNSGSLPPGRLEYRILWNAHHCFRNNYTKHHKVMNKPTKIIAVIQMCITLNRLLQCHSNNTLLKDALLYTVLVLLQLSEDKVIFHSKQFLFHQSETKCWNLAFNFSVWRFKWGVEIESKLTNLKSTPRSVQPSPLSCHFLWLWKGKLHLSCLRGGCVWTWVCLHCSERLCSGGRLGCVCKESFYDLTLNLEIKSNIR